jgi:hypothetical protein
VGTTELYGMVLSLGVAAVALALLAWQWAESRSRASDVFDEDPIYFARQDVRRWVVVGVLLLLAGGVFAGSRMEPRLPAGPNPNFIETWIGVFILVIVLLVLAMVDWLATRSYATRHRRAIVREGLEILREEIRLRALRPTNGQAVEGSNGRDLT